MTSETGSARKRTRSSAGPASSPQTANSASKRRKLSDAASSPPQGMRRTRRSIAEGAEVEASSAKENLSPPHMTEQPKGELKSALTPSRGGRGTRSGRSVAFEVKSAEKDMDLGFKDIPTPAVATETPARKRGRPPKSKTPETAGKIKKTTVTETVVVEEEQADVEPENEEAEGEPEVGAEEEPSASPEKEISPESGHRRPPRVSAPTSFAPPPKTKKVPVVRIPSANVEESNSEDEDDELCVVCQSGESEPPNEILFCDNCDRAFHQQCCDPPIAEVPEDDWLCKDCDPEQLPIVEELQPIEVEDLMNMPIELPPAVEAIVKGSVPAVEGLDGHLRAMQGMVLEKLMGRRSIGLIGLEDEFAKVYQVVEQTVVSGEGNSMLIIGARGCGKTTLVEKVIFDLSEKNRENFHVVRLNGFIHTDDKLALRDIWRQLGREMEVEEDLTSKTNNYADTLASLLALLSHPDEISAADTGATAKSVVFVIDEFDLFTQHARQTLLYNLFDIAQARKAPIAVLGVTTKIDVVEALEKRVKSRFSHRYVHLPLPKSFVAYREICRQGITVDPMEFMELRSETLHHEGSGDFTSYWEIMIEELLKDTNFEQHLKRLFYRTKSVQSFFTTAVLPISSLSTTALPLTVSTFHNSFQLSPPDSKLSLLPSLSTFDLALLISAARLDVVLDTDTVNFSMAYDEYCNLTTSHKIASSSTGIAALGAGAKVWGREVAIGAWERLIEVELLLPANTGGNGVGGGGGGVEREGRMWRVDVGLEEIPGAVELSAVMGKWCREI